MEQINDNAYKLDLPGEYAISAMFNVSDLSYFDAGADSRSNLFQEEENDANPPLKAQEEELKMPIGPITRSKSRRLQQAFNGLIQAQVRPIVEESIKESSIQDIYNLFEAQWFQPAQSTN